MVAPAYAAQRSALAKSIGLGHKPAPAAGSRKASAAPRPSPSVGRLVARRRLPEPTSLTGLKSRQAPECAWRLCHILHFVGYRGSCVCATLGIVRLRSSRSAFSSGVTALARLPGFLRGTLSTPLSIRSLYGPTVGPKTEPVSGRSAPWRGPRSRRCRCGEQVRPAPACLHARVVTRARSGPCVG